MAKDYYQILGVARDASADEIKRRFRQLARESHPDANPDDPTAEARFREVAEAYEVLSDPSRRTQYDQFGHQEGGSPFGGGFGGQGFEFRSNVDDLFGEIFGDLAAIDNQPRAGNRSGDAAHLLVHQDSGTLRKARGGIPI